MSERRELGCFWLLALLVMLAIAPAGPSYWDSFGYTAQSVTGAVGGLALGRPLFIFIGHQLVRLALGLGADVSALEPMLRYFWTAVSALSAPMMLLLATALGLSRAASRWAALCLAVSPAMAHTSGQVLTDGPTVAMVLAATWFAVRAGQREGAAASWAGAGVMFGAAIVFREPSLAHGLVLAGLVFVAKPGTRVKGALVATLAGLAFAGVWVAWAAQQPGWVDTVRNWVSEMQRERLDHPYTARDFAMYLVWLVTLGPVMLVAGVIGWARAKTTFAPYSRAVLVVAAGSLVQLLMLGGYQDIVLAPRYLLGAMPGALALVAGITLASWARTPLRTRALVGVMLALVVVTALGVKWKERPLRDALDSVGERLAREETPLVLVTGQVCPAVELLQTLERQRSPEAAQRVSGWTRVCYGWSWPRDLSATLQAHLDAGEFVIADLREAVWPGDRQQQAKRELAAWVEATHHPHLRVWRD